MKIRNLLYLSILLAVTLLAGIYFGSRMSHRSILPGKKTTQQATDKLSNIIRLVDAAYVDTINAKDLVEKSIPSILENLDPHSTYIPFRDMQEVEEEMQGNFSGIGVQFSIQEDTIMIVDAISGGPSARLGILAGDRIVMVNDSVVAGKGIKNDQVFKLLRGKKGTKVKVSILRKGFKNLFDFDITRGEIPIYSVDVSYMIDNETGFIKVSRFGEQTYKEFTDAMEKLDKSGASKIIIDLRGNPGGYLAAVIRMVNDFLEKGDMILVTKGKSQPEKTYTANTNNIWSNKKLYLLIDEFSASASEIFAGAIQDNDRGIVIGLRSFGKGLVQEQIPFSDGSALRLTVARYYTPSGRSIQKSYKEGNEKYFEDLFARMKHGEYRSADSIHFADSLKYRTKNGRTVYGGGGIMPDFYVPFDTTGRSSYYEKIFQKGLINQFTFHYSDQYRKTLEKLSGASAIADYLEKQNILQNFVDFATSKGVPADGEGLKVSGYIIKTQLKAIIARNIMGEEGFYPIIQEIDKTLLKAIEISKQNLLVENVGKHE
jgi:carboxyl-terminal processing protease